MGMMHGKEVRERALPATGPTELNPSKLKIGTVAAAGVTRMTPLTTWKKVW
jgi:hypothetical protein